MKNRFLFIALLFFFLCLFSLTFYGCGGEEGRAEGYDWPRWRGPNGDGVSKETDWNAKTLMGGPKILWKCMIGLGYSNVAVQQNRVYAVGRDDAKTTLYCLNADNGKKLWSHMYKGGTYAYGPAASPTVDGAFLYTIGSAGHVFCFNAESGRVMWKTNIVKDHGALEPQYGFAASPVVEGGLLVMTANAYGIALNKMTGALAWMSPITDTNAQGGSMINAYATPVIFTREGRKYFCQFDDYGLYEVDLLTGHPSWFFPWPPEKSGSWANVADPIFHSGKLFISTGYGIGCALIDIRSGAPVVLWQNKNMNNHLSSCILIDGYLYGCHDPVGWGGGGILRCLDIRTGQVMWEQDLEMTVSLSAADKKLIILTERGLLIIVDASPEAYRELSRAQVLKVDRAVKSWTPPVLCRGRIYCRSQAGELICIDARR